MNSRRPRPTAELAATGVAGCGASAAGAWAALDAAKIRSGSSGMVQVKHRGGLLAHEWQMKSSVALQLASPLALPHMRIRKSADGAVANLVRSGRKQPQRFRAGSSASTFPSLRAKRSNPAVAMDCRAAVASRNDASEALNDTDERRRIARPWDGPSRASRP